MNDRTKQETDVSQHFITQGKGVNAEWDYGEYLRLSEREEMDVYVNRRHLESTFSSRYLHILSALALEKADVRTKSHPGNTYITSASTLVLPLILRFISISKIDLSILHTVLRKAKSPTIGRRGNVSTSAATQRFDVTSTERGVLHGRLQTEY